MSQSEVTPIPDTTTPTDPAVHTDSGPEPHTTDPDSIPIHDNPPSPSPSDLNHLNDQTQLDESNLQQQLDDLDLKEKEEDNETEKVEEEDGEAAKGDTGWEETDNYVAAAEEEVEDYDDENDENLMKNGGRTSHYPVRPEAEDCAYYIKTGLCKFGSNCKFNHPVRRKNQPVKERVREKDESTEKHGQTECKYYLRTGGCKFGKACRYNHSRAKTSVTPMMELNFLGLPIRLGEKECPYYMRNGSCKYGANCRFNHPDPTGAGDSPAAYSNGGSVSSQAASQVNMSSWSSPRALNETATYMPMMFSPTQGIPPPNPEWNGYHQTSVYPPPERSLHPTPPYAVNNPSTESTVYTHHHPPMVVDEFPVRPGQPECSYFMKTGDCKYKSNCKYHHPRTRAAKPTSCALSDKGLPLRPEQTICSHYSRYGICKFGPACKFDHSMQAAPSTVSGLDQPLPFSNSAGTEQTVIAGNNVADTAVQQSV